LLNKFLVGKKSSNSALYSKKWKENFSRRPTWCDADMALQQINQGAATGNRTALYSRSFFQYLLFNLGTFVQEWAYTVIIISLLSYLICAFGLQNVRIETDIVKLWVSEGGRLDEELNFLSRIKQSELNFISRNKRLTNETLCTLNAAIKPVNMKLDNENFQVPKENGLGGGFQVVIQTTEVKGFNVLNKISLLKHVDLMQEIANIKVEMFGENWTLSDICFKPPAPKFGTGPLSGTVSALLDRIIPCIWITPIDCFWEGSKPLGPHPPLNLGSDIQSFIPSIPKGDISWKNLDPFAVVNDIEAIFDIGTIKNFFERSGIGGAYTDRWCIDPLDPECPLTAPNGFDRCAALKKFIQWNLAKPMDQQIQLDIDLLSGEVNILDDESFFHKLFGNFFIDFFFHRLLNFLKTSFSSLLKWMNNNRRLWEQFLSPDELPVFPDYGQLMTGGCHGFAKNTMKWPEDLIIGGVKHENYKLISAEAFQSVFLVASGQDVYLRFKDLKPDVKPNLDLISWSPSKANEVVAAWQRNFTEKLYNHKWNDEKKNIRLVHPLAATSIEDMLKEFSQFKFFVIFVGYLLMCIYAGWSQLKWDGWWFAVDSCVELSILGVLLVTYASISGLGLSTWLDIQFNAATTQIVPFLTLGLGVDDMFLLLYNYNELMDKVKDHEIGVLMKETGMSIVITSTNNIIAFMAGTVLPIPALRSFCSQSAILLSFNLVAIMVIYPAFIAVDLRRRKLSDEIMAISNGTKAMSDFSFSSHVYPGPPSVHPIINGKPLIDKKNDVEWYTLNGFLHHYYIPFLQKRSTKMLVLIMCSSMFLFGCIGLYHSTLGLELSDVLPEGTAPAAFLRARERYFSFYPMYAILKGPNIDYPQKQELIEQYRLDIAKSDFVIKVDGLPSEQYWLSLLRAWLISLQVHLDNALKKGEIDKLTGNIINSSDTSVEVNIARLLTCSVGRVFNCSDRIGKVRLVDHNGVINREGFYNYLTGWYNIDNMMYYVSQASFYPIPPSWSYSDNLVPPAEPPAYSQIPFYLTKLVDTPIIVDMITEIRSICERYNEIGLPNFPSGLPWHLFLAICVIASSVFIVISMLIFNPWAAFMVMVVVVSMTVELAGFMGLAGVKLNPVSAVTLITAVGIGVEFTAHVVLAFLTSLGTKNERMASCLDHMFIPVIHGGLSTLLGILMLAFSEFEFVVKYFFVVMSALIVIGLINGLILLPVLLSLIGPRCEIQPISGGKYLPVPPPFSLNICKTLKGIESNPSNRIGGAFVEMQASFPIFSSRFLNSLAAHTS
uniref:SSD domain-containing protein n=1 Tax=Dracunculus medinensis TaxID=318479 RepID=A0A0N4ULA9_DRAME